MSEPIYKIFLNRFRDAYYQLSESERDAFVQKYNKAYAELGVKEVCICYTGWSTEEYDFAGVTVYPDMDAVVKLRLLQEEWGWFRYVDAKAVLGTALPENLG